MLNEKTCIKKRVLLQLALLLLVFVSSYVQAESKKEEWESANRPNYETNVDLKYQYSESAFQDDRPDCAVFSGKYGNWEPCIDATSAGNNILDFWGEGRIIEGTLITGFKDSYNVNHQYQLVSNGPDRDRKIPNRIPIKDYDNVCLTKYITDDSFSIVTIMGAPIIEKTIREMLRVIKKDHSSAIIAYGYKQGGGKPHLKLLTEILKKNNFIENPYYHFSDKLLEPSEEPVAFTYHEREEKRDL